MGLGAAAVLFLAFSVFWFGIRDTWEIDNYSTIIHHCELVHLAINLSDDKAAVQAYSDLDQLIGRRKLERDVLAKRLEEVRQAFIPVGVRAEIARAREDEALAARQRETEALAARQREDDARKTLADNGQRDSRPSSNSASSNGYSWTSSTNNEKDLYCNDFSSRLNRKGKFAYISARELKSKINAFYASGGHPILSQPIDDVAVLIITVKTLQK